LTPPRALICRTWMRAAASAGPSNGAMLPLLSYAQPITMAGLVAAELSPATPTTAAKVIAAPRRSAAATPHFLFRMLTPPASNKDKFEQIEARY
jgi:hypothetical protein